MPTPSAIQQLPAAATDGKAPDVKAPVVKGVIVASGSSAYGTHANHARVNLAAIKLNYTRMPSYTPSSLRSSLTMASSCKVEGDGLRRAIVRQMAIFTIIARNAADELIKMGGDKFNVAMRGASALRARVFDNEDGTYTVSYFPSTSGRYNVSITLNGISLPGSPFAVDVLAARADPSRCQLRGEALHSATAREPTAFECSFLDGLGQYTHADDLDVYVELLPPTDDGTDGLERLIRAFQSVADKERQRAERQVALLIKASQGEAAAAVLSQPATKNTASKNAKHDAKGSAAAPSSLSPEQHKRQPTKEIPATEQKALPVDEESEPDKAGADGGASSAQDGAAALAKVEAKVAEALRCVAGLKPLIVRVSCELDAEALGMLAVGGLVRVVEARPTEHGVRAKVELQLCRTTDELNGGAQLSARFAYSVASPGGDTRPGSAPSYRPVLPSYRTGSAGGGTHRQFGADSSFVLPTTTSEGSPRSRAMRLHCFLPDRAHRHLWGLGDDDDGTEMTHGTSAPPQYGWVTATKQGTIYLAPVHEQLEAGERQRHLTLWARRKAADNAAKAAGAKMQSREDRTHVHEPSQAHELSNDKAGFAFAFGGVEPGSLHAHGTIIKAHTVRYSVGLAGRYWLHVGLRQQAVALPGSPFLLVVSPGAAHAQTTHLEVRDLPLRGGVGKAPEDGCTVLIHTSDRMGNLCTNGGALVQAALDKHGANNEKYQADELDVNVVDHLDGSYSISLRSEISGTYPVRVTIDNTHIAGSPTTVVISAATPEVSKCAVSGDGLKAARAGLPAAIKVSCKDRYGNVAQRSDNMRFGLLLAPRDQNAKEEAPAGPPRGSVPKEREPAGASRGKDASNKEAKDRRDPLDALANAKSMAFTGQWLDERIEGERVEAYHISYTAQEAGDFFLHVWMDPDGCGVRKSVVGSPFPVRVSGVRASPAGSFLGGVDKYLSGSTQGQGSGRGADLLGDKAPNKATDEPSAMASASAEPRADGAKLGVGERIVLRPQLRDEYGNASSAPNGELKAWIENPERTRVELELKQLAQLGAYEIAYESKDKGLHAAHVVLDGEEITGSPFKFIVMPGPAVGSKSHLTHVSEPAIINVPCELRLQTVDKFGNTLDVGGATIAARAMGTAVSQCTVEDNKDGTYSIRFTSSVEGEGRVIVRLDNMEMAPITVQFIAPRQHG